MKPARSARRRGRGTGGGGLESGSGARAPSIGGERQARSGAFVPERDRAREAGRLRVGQAASATSGNGAQASNATRSPLAGSRRAPRRRRERQEGDGATRRGTGHGEVRMLSRTRVPRSEKRRGSSTVVSGSTVGRALLVEGARMAISTKGTGRGEGRRIMKRVSLIAAGLLAFGWTAARGGAGRRRAHDGHSRAAAPTNGTSTSSRRAERRRRERQSGAVRPRQAARRRRAGRTPGDAARATST
jgi:hypothetical protein